MIYIEKCMDMTEDSSCDNAPIDLAFDLVLRACLNDGTVGTPSMQFVDIPVRAELTSPCSSNTISLTNTLDLIEYSIQTPAEPFTYQPSLISDYPNCPIICRLVEMPGETPYNVEIV